jgi:hypothetical protein
MSTTSAIAAGEGVCTDNAAPWATVAGELVIYEQKIGWSN